MSYSALLPLEEVASFTTAQVQGRAVAHTLGQVGPQDNALSPVVEVPQKFDGTLKNMMYAGG